MLLVLMFLQAAVQAQEAVQNNASIFSTIGDVTTQIIWWVVAAMVAGMMLVPG